MPKSISSPDYYDHIHMLVNFVQLLLVMLAFGCGSAEPVHRPINAVVVLIDALRADHLGAYGYSRPTSPNVDAFARGALLFEQARAQAPCTHPSVASLLSAVQPARFAGFGGLGFAIPPRFPTIAAILSERGWQTAAVSASPIVRHTPSPKNPTGGYGAGFGRFVEDCLDRDADCVNAAAQELLDTLEEPFFLYLHYMEPHDPYRPPDGFERLFAGSGPRQEFIAEGDPKPIAAMTYAKSQPVDVSDDDWRHLVNLYDDEIRYFDARFGELVDEIDSRGLADRTIVAVVADHGEEFFEHGDVMHCRNVHDVEVRTPLIVRVPGEPPARVRAPVGNVDVVPTLLDYLEIDPGDFRFDGRSLRGLAGAESPSGPEKRTVFGAWRNTAFAVDGELKLIYERESGESRLYDLAADPGETLDVSGERTSEAAQLRSQLFSHRASFDRPGGSAAAQDAQLIERLRELGYLQ